MYLELKDRMLKCLFLKRLSLYLKLKVQWTCTGSNIFWMSCGFGIAESEDIYQ